MKTPILSYNRSGPLSPPPSLMEYEILILYRGRPIIDNGVEVYAQYSGGNERLRVGGRFGWL